MSCVIFGCFERCEGLDNGDVDFNESVAPLVVFVVVAVVEVANVVVFVAVAAEHKALPLLTGDNLLAVIDFCCCIV